MLSLWWVVGWSKAILADEATLGLRGSLAGMACVDADEVMWYRADAGGPDEADAADERLDRERVDGGRLTDKV